MQLFYLEMRQTQLSLFKKYEKMINISDSSEKKLFNKLRNPS